MASDTSMGPRSHYSELLDQAVNERLSRRSILKRAAALGLTAPALAAILAACGGGDSDNATSEGDGGSGSGSTSTTGGDASPTSSEGSGSSEGETGGEAGGDGELRLLWWQAPTILNSHLSQGTKDFDASRVHLEPLADFDDKTQMVAQLAAEVPSLDNGMVAKDGLSVTWKLREGVKWHDGQPFTAKDVEFTFRYLSDPKTSATTYGSYKNVDKVEVVDDLTAKVHFKEPEPAWYQAFVGSNGMILPEHVLRDFIGENARNAPFNLKPIGTGAFRVVDFRPGDVVQWERNPDYWDKGKPHFDTVNMKGGGDSASAARGVLQAGEADWAWNIQVEPAVLKSLESSGQGKVVTWPGSGTEKLLINMSDPETEKDGQRSHRDVPHPHFKVKEVRQALSVSIPRDVIAKTLYGSGGDATALTMNESEPYMPKDIQWEYDLDKAKQLLDTAGAKPGGDGVRELNGRKMRWVYQTSVNSVRQKTQELVKDSLKEIGIDTTLKSIDASVYFSGDAGNNDTTGHFYADLEMYTNAAGVFPLLWYQRYLSADPTRDIAQKENQWSGNNYMRYQSQKFNDLWLRAKQELDPDKSKEIFIEMQRLIAVEDIPEIGITARRSVACASNQITNYTVTPWASDVWDLKEWKKA